MVQVLARENQRAGAIGPLNRIFPGNCRLNRIGRAPGIQIRRTAQTGHLLDRLVGRAILAQTDGVMGKHIQHTLTHQRRHTHRITGVLHEDQEGRTVGDEAAVQRHAVHDRAHAEFTYAVVHVVTRGIRRLNALAAGPQGQVGPGQIGRAAKQLRQQRTKGIQTVLAGLAAGDGLALGDHVSHIGCSLVGKISRQLTGDAPLELGCQLRIGLLIGGKAGIPFRLGDCTGSLGIPFGINIRRNLERTMAPVQCGTGGGDFIITQRRTVTLFLALLVRRTKTNDGLAADQRRLTGILARGLDGHLDLIGIVTIDIADHLPTVSLEALRRVVAEPAFYFTINRNPVVIVEGNQLAQTQGAR